MAKQYKIRWIGVAKLAIIVVLGLYCIHLFSAGANNITNGQEPYSAPPAKDAPATLLEQYRDVCWTADQTPKAELPSAAIVQFKSGKTVFVTNATPRGWKLVDEAFNEALAAAGYGDKTSDKIDVIALCV